MNGDPIYTPSAKVAAIGLRALALMFFAFCGLLAPATAQESVAPRAEFDFSDVFTAKNQRPFVGVYSRAGGVTCARCHEQERMADAWAYQNEVTTWKDHGSHDQAFEVLKSPLSEKIGKHLGLKKGEVYRDKRCLTCHVGLPAHQLEPADQPLISEAFAANPVIQNGVSCESCHGPSGTADNQPGWRYVHTDGDQNNQWRFKSELEKLAFGYYDVRSPTLRARMCLSCHQGNVEQGKIITHDMFAAGHPPLPGFESVMFVNQQPRHWRRLSEKQPAIRDAYLKARQVAPPKEGRLVRTRDMLVSAVVASSESFRLAADLADRDIAPPTPLSQRPWPELSQFACYNCHHDLQKDSWRRKRGFRLRPGRPDLHEWPITLTEVALDVAGEAKPLDEVAKELILELNSRPFGGASEFPGKARKVADWLDAIAARLEANQFDTPMGDKTLDALARRAGTRDRDLIDYDSARQLVWAFDVTYRELHKPPLGVAETRRWYRDSSQVRLSNLDPAERRLAAFDQTLLLDLRSGKKTPFKSPETLAAVPEAALISAYDAKDFQQQFLLLYEAFKSLHGARGIKTRAKLSGLQSIVNRAK